MIPELLKKIDQVPLWSDRFYCSPPEATPKGVSLVFGNNAKLCQATALSGPGTEAGPQDPVASTGYWMLANATRPSMQVFSSPGSYSWIRPEGHKHAYVILCGGGGASGDVPITGTGQFSASSGAGGGGYAEKFIADISKTVNVTVGAGGARVTGATGQSGGISSFGAYVSATGGTGSSVGYATSFGHTSSAIGIGAGGLGVGGDININGGDGSRIIVFDHNTTYRHYDSGGACAMFGLVQTVAVGIVPGQGARGQVQINQNANSAAGVAGGPGIVVVWSW